MKSIIERYIILTDKHVSTLIDLIKEIKEPDQEKYHYFSNIGVVGYKLIKKNNVLKISIEDYNLDISIRLNSFAEFIGGNKFTINIERAFEFVRQVVSKFPVFKNYHSSISIICKDSYLWSYILDDINTENTRTKSTLLLSTEHDKLREITSFMLKYELTEDVEEYPLTTKLEYDEGIYHRRKLDLDTEITLDLLDKERVFWRISRAELYE